MNKLVIAATASALLASSAFSQEVQAGAQGFQAMKMIGAVKGSPVKGAPYSGEEVTETTHVLADGTRIHQESKTLVYRDSEGRMRRENPGSITITDPVGNTTYVLNSKTMTGNKMGMAAGVFTMNRTNTVTSSTGANSFTFTTSTDGPATETKVYVNGETVSVTGNPDEAKRLAEAKARADTATAMAITVDRVKAKLAGAKAGEPLGKQMMEGVEAEGTRNVTTIPVGDIGNDRPIQITNESWYSADLKLTIMTKRSDPRTGDETFRLTNINRAEPAPYLFQLPAGYQINERR